MLFLLPLLLLLFPFLPLLLLLLFDVLFDLEALDVVVSFAVVFATLVVVAFARLVVVAFARLVVVALASDEVVEVENTDNEVVEVDNTDEEVEVVEVEVAITAWFVASHESAGAPNDALGESARSAVTRKGRVLSCTITTEPLDID